VTDQSGGSLGDYRLRPSAADQRTRDGCRSAARSPAVARSAAGGGRAIVESRAHVDKMPIRETADVAIPELAVMQRRFLLAGAAGVAVSLVGLLFDVRQFLQSYLMAYMLC